MKQLHIAILAQLDSQTITQELAPVLRDRGHHVDIIDISTVSRTDFIDQPEITTLIKYDLVYYRSGLNTNENSERIFKLESFLAKYPIRTINLHYTAHPKANSKIYEAKQAQLNGLTVPKSVFTVSADFTSLSTQLGLPFIAKTDYGTQGIGVHMVKDESGLLTVQQSYTNNELFYQQFVPHDFEYRVHAIADQAICMYKKSPPSGDFRSNVSQGGQMLIADPRYTQELTRLTNDLFSIFDFEIFVADFMLDKNTDTFYFTEINLNPGWELSDMEVTGIDVTKLTADYFERICS